MKHLGEKPTLKAQINFSILRCPCIVIVTGFSRSMICRKTKNKKLEDYIMKSQKTSSLGKVNKKGRSLQS